MSEKNSVSSFDQLSTEIVFEIFDYLSYNDIIYTFFYLNQRFNSILFHHRRFLNNFTTPINNLSFWQTILPIISSQIECLIITTTDFCFPFDSFPNLKSLIISSSIPIYHDELTLILKSEQFKKLNSFKIKSEIFNRTGVYERLFIHNILHDQNSLHIFECLPEIHLSFTDMNNLKINVNLQSLSLKVLDLKCIVSLLDYTPNLKYLNVLIILFMMTKESTANIDLSKIKLNKLSIVLQYGVINQRFFPTLTWFIKQFSSSLNYLSLNINEINTDEFRFDGFTLQQQVLESMIQLKSFHLYTKLNKEPMNVERFLSTFETQFWFDHKWAIGIDGIYLYTLPFHFDKLKDFIDFHKIKSTNSVVLNSPKTWSHVTSIDSPGSSNFSLNIIKQLKLKITNLQSIACTFHLMQNLFTNDDEINQTDIKLNSVTTVRCVGVDLQTIKRLLINIFPNTRHLMLYYGPHSDTLSSKRMKFSPKLDEYFCGTDYIYLSKVQYVNIKLEFKDLDYIDQHVIHLIKELLEMFKNLQSFIFHFYQMHEFPHTGPITDLNNIIQLFNMEKVSEKYQIKQLQNYLQFVRKNNQ